MSRRQPLLQPTMDEMEDDDEEEEGFGRQLKRKKCDWRCVLLSLICLLFIFLIFLVIYLLIKKDDSIINEVKKEELAKKFMNKTQGNSEEEMCQLMTGECVGGNGSRLVGGNENIFFLLHDPKLTVVEACSIESVLRLTPDKTVYTINLWRNSTKVKKRNSNAHAREIKFDERCSENDKEEEEVDYLQRLMKLYRNLDVLNVDKNEFFKNTFVNENALKCCNTKKMQFVMKLLTAYKFGGVVFSADALMNNRLFLDVDYDVVKVDRSVVMVPDKCDSYLYYLYELFRHCDIFKDERTTLDEIIKKSLDLYCGREDASARGCSGVRLFDDREICDRYEPSCSLVRTSELSNKHLLRQMPKFCHQVVKAYIGPSLDREEVEDEQRRLLYELEKPTTPKAGTTCHCKS